MDKTLWEIEAIRGEAIDLPSRIWTRKPPLLTSNIDPLLLLLLPAGAQASENPDLKFDISALNKDECAGLWLGSPFFNIASFADQLQDTEKCWVSNFPPVSYQDAEFLEQLIDVGLGPDWETKNLKKLNDAGHKILYVVPADNALECIADLMPEACLIIIRTREELEAVRSGLASKIRNITHSNMPIALLGLHKRVPRYPEELGIDALLKEPT